MDAKPQRARFLPSVGGENVPLSKQQALHGRHKSTGNLALSASTAAMKANTKRMPFGDVSNTTRIGFSNDHSKSDKQSLSILSTKDKTTNGGIKKEFSRPAQRPSVYRSAASKVTLPPISSIGIDSRDTTDAMTVVKQTNFNNKTTVVFADNEMDTATHTTASTAFRQPRHHKSQPQLMMADSVCSSIDIDLLSHSKSSYLPTTMEDEDRDIHFHDAKESFAAESVNSHHDTMDAVQQVYSSDADYYHHEMVSHEDMIDNCATSPQTSNDHNLSEYRYDFPHSLQDVTPLASDVEENWVEEEEEDCIIVDAAYTTTGSYDTVIDLNAPIHMPKVTPAIEQELEAARVFVELNRSPEEQEEEAWDVTMAAEYGEEIFDYLRELEMRMLPDSGYMQRQTEIQWSMRAVLMDWLVQVHGRFGLLPETLFATVNYVDRFLSHKVVSIGKLQLVGAIAILVASKYEEINCPSLQEIEFMVDGGYKMQEIIKAERYMLSFLSFDLGWPGPMSFLRRISKADDYDLETRTLAKYFLEVTIMDQRFVGTPASYLAAGAHCLSRLILYKGDWSQAHVHYSGYTLDQLKPLMAVLFSCCENPGEHHASIYQKYCDRRYKRCAEYVQQEMANGFTLFPQPASMASTSMSHFGYCRTDDQCHQQPQSQQSQQQQQQQQQQDSYRFSRILARTEG